MRDILRLLRPRHWIKNAFVFAPLVFALRFTDPASLLRAGIAFLAFSLASSIVYIINDLADREADSNHPAKKQRPLASGAVSPGVAVITACLAGLAALAFALHTGRDFTVVIGIYILLNLAYSFRLKHLVLLDVMAIAAGFILRILGGGFAVGVPVSRWLFLTTFTLALFLGFCKRRNELLLIEGTGGQRPVLGQYSERFLDQLILISATLAVVCYALYTIDAEVVVRLGTPHLLYTLPFVLYGLFRYLFLIYKKAASGDPAEMLLRDPGLLITILLWGGTVLFLIWPRMAG